MTICPRDVNEGDFMTVLMHIIIPRPPALNRRPEYSCGYNLSLARERLTPNPAYKSSLRIAEQLCYVTASVTSDAKVRTEKSQVQALTCNVITATHADWNS